MAKPAPSSAPPASERYDRQTVLDRYRRVAEVALDPSLAPACPLSSHSAGHPEPVESTDPAFCDADLCRGCCLALVAQVERAAAAPTFTAVELNDTASRAEDLVRGVARGPGPLADK